MFRITFGAAILATALAGPALADKILISPGSLVANGDVNAVFAFKDADDKSQLLKVTVGNVIFDNQVDVAGTTKNIGFNSGLIQFELNNKSQLYSFINDVADLGTGGDGAFHAKYGTTQEDFGVTFSAATNTALANLAAVGGGVILVGYEDRRNGDYDYNDLIFAFSAVQVAVPEPASLALLGIGLFGVGMLRRGRTA